MIIRIILYILHIIYILEQYQPMPSSIAAWPARIDIFAFDRCLRRSPWESKRPLFCKVNLTKAKRTWSGAVCFSSWELYGFGGACCLCSKISYHHIQCCFQRSSLAVTSEPPGYCERFHCIPFRLVFFIRFHRKFTFHGILQT